MLLLGRSGEKARIDQLFRDVADGLSAALVIRGEPGIGKSALLEYAREQAADRGVPVVSGVGIEAEIELPYAALHLILAPALPRMEVLPRPQADALRGAFGLGDGRTTDPFLVGLATLTLLSEHAYDGPLLCLIDDAQWLDRSSTAALCFAARRLGAEGVVMLFAVRADDTEFSAYGLPEMHVHRLDRDDSAALLQQVVPDLALPVRERILAEAGGNPLALRELPAVLTAEQRAGWLAPVASPSSDRSMLSRVEAMYRARVRDLPRTTRSLLLVLATDDTGELSAVLDAAGRLGADLTDLERAEADHLVDVAGTRLAFRHHLIRSATYNAATAAQRLAAHRALAEAFEVGSGSDRAAWHRAAASTRPDEAVASALELGAEHARTRGGCAAVAAAYQRAAELTPDASRRIRRLAMAARAAADAGHAARAAELVDLAEPHATEPRVIAELVQVRSTIAHEQDQPHRAVQLAQAASAIAPDDPRRAAAMFLDAITAAWASNNHADVNAVARLADVSSSDPFLARLSAAIVHMTPDEPHRGMPYLRELVEVHSGDSEDDIWLRIGVQWWFQWLADTEVAHQQASSLERECRAIGAIGLLPRALTYLSRVQLARGTLRAARSVADEGLRIALDTDQAHFAGHLNGILACVAAIHGHEEDTRTFADASLGEGLTERGVEGLHALNVLDLGLGRPESVLERFDRLAAGPGRSLALGHYTSLPDYVEAGVRAGRADLAAEAAVRFSGWADATKQAWTRAVDLRCRALLAEGDDAMNLYADAVDLHTDDGPPFERARTELLFGTWLRRRLRRNDARPHLRRAGQIFDQLGAVPWSHRAGAELRAAGGSPEPTPRQSVMVDRLTPQEARVVRLAADGLSNRAIAAHLFLSPRTVGYHLYKAYPKLGVASRHELARLEFD